MPTAFQFYLISVSVFPVRGNMAEVKAALGNLASAHPTYLLPLTDTGAPDIPGDHNYIYLPPPSTPPYCVKFCIEGTSRFCRKGSLWVNVPAEGEQFERSHFREFR